MSHDDDDEMTAEELLGENAEVWKRRALEAEAKLAAAERELAARDLSGEVLARTDAVLNGPNPETHWRSLHDIDTQVAALKTKLAALVQAIDVAMANGYETDYATRDALDAARGEP